MANMEWNDIIQKYKKYIFQYIATLIIFILIVYLSTDPLALTTRGFLYLFIMLLPIFYLLINIYFKNSLNVANYNAFYVFTAVFLLLFIGTIYFYSKMSSTNILLFSYFVAFLLIMIIIVAFVIFYNVFFEYLNKQTGNLGYFIQFIFYIPCLFNDLFKYLLEQYKITPNIVFILFIFEILLIILYIYLPKLFNLLFKPSTNQILMKPVYLNTQTTINNKLPPLPNMNEINDKTQLNKPPKVFRNNNYGLSMWIYVNENVTTNDETEIMNFCGGKPRITYLNNGNHVNSYYIYFTDNVKQGSATEDNRYILYLNNQKWNYFAFSYYSNSVDLFINGKLERTFIFTNNTPLPIKQSDVISVGKNNGLNGAICNILYYTAPLTKFQVANTYNLLMNQNPPVDIL